MSIVAMWIAECRYRESAALKGGVIVSESSRDEFHSDRAAYQVAILYAQAGGSPQRSWETISASGLRLSGPKRPLG